MDDTDDEKLVGVTALALAVSRYPYDSSHNHTHALKWLSQHKAALMNAKIRELGECNRVFSVRVRFSL